MSLMPTEVVDVLFQGMYQSKLCPRSSLYLLFQYSTLE